MIISYQPKYENKANIIKQFVKENSLDSLELNLIIGGDGSGFVYKNANLANYLIPSHKHSFGHYASSWFEDDWKKDLINYSINPERFNTLIDTIQIEIDNNIVKDFGINDVLIGKDYSLKAIVEDEIIFDTGLLIYTQNGFSGWAKKYEAIPYKNALGMVMLDKRVSKKIIDEVTIKCLPYHDFEIMVDGKTHSLKKNYVDTSNTSIENIILEPLVIGPNQVVKIRKGKPIVFVKMK